MTWALKRQLFYVAVLLFFFGGLGFFLTYPYFHKSATCNDNRQNGNETGIDCGGSCSLACIAEVDKISVIWARSFEVVPGRYNAVAYIENHNRNSAISKINYRFRFADKDNLYIGKRDGETTIPPAGRYAIFESAIDVGNSVPVFTTFEFTATPVWNQVATDKIKQLKVVVSAINLENETTSPHLSATIKNSSLFIIPDISVIAILYDNTGNAIATSRTYLDQLRGEESREINFTWPQPIVGKVVAKEIIPLYNIFSVKLK